MAEQKVLVQDALKFSLNSHTLSDFTLSSGYLDFRRKCRQYLQIAAATNFSSQPRFKLLSFEGFINYNYHSYVDEYFTKKYSEKGNLEKESLGKEKFEREKLEKSVLNTAVENWRVAIKSLQRYCLNLLLAPKRKDFCRIKVTC